MEDMRTRIANERASLQAAIALMDEAAVEWFDALARGVRDLRPQHNEWRVREQATRRHERRLRKLERKLEDQKGGDRA